MWVCADCQSVIVLFGLKRLHPTRPLPLKAYVFTTTVFLLFVLFFCVQLWLKSEQFFYNNVSLDLRFLPGSGGRVCFLFPWLQAAIDVVYPMLQILSFSLEEPVYNFLFYSFFNRPTTHYPSCASQLLWPVRYSVVIQPAYWVPLSFFFLKEIGNMLAHTLDLLLPPPHAFLLPYGVIWSLNVSSASFKGSSWLGAILK